MKILLVTHAPLDPAFGAAQVAMSLAAALGERGHDAAAFSPEPLPADTGWHNLRRRQRRAIEAWAAAHGPYDVIDTPALTASRRLARSGPLLVRNVQPELRYLWRGLRDELARPLPLRGAVDGVLAVPTAAAVAAGWRRARAILCLGSLELAWMQRRFPMWRGKLGRYFNTPPAAERPALAAVHRRRAFAGGDALRYLWLGRWTAHKGTRRLVRFVAERLAAGGGDRFTLAGCGEAPARDLPGEWLRSGRVTLVPAFRRAELPALLAAHEAGLFTSDVEGWGLSLNEMLESGMPVFATRAGAVADLAPYFPRSLRPFPPPAWVAGGAPEDLAANGYLARFSWPAIAADWERQALVATGTGA